MTPEERDEQSSLDPNNGRTYQPKKNTDPTTQPELKLGFWLTINFWLMKRADRIRKLYSRYIIKCPRVYNGFKCLGKECVCHKAYYEDGMDDPKNLYK